MSNPAVTVLMTTYNAGRCVSGAMETILNQTFEDFEFLIVDDGSSDDTCARVKSFGDPRIRLIERSENMGQTASLNEGLALAQGHYLARQDADDYSHPRRLEEQVAEFERDAGLVLLGTQGVVCDVEGHLRGLLYLPLTAEEIGDWFRIGNPLLHTSVMFVKEAAKAVGGYDERFRICQDYDLWERLRGSGKIRNLSALRVAYTLSEHSLSHKAASRTASEAEEIRRRLASARMGGAAAKSGRIRALKALHPEGGSWRMMRLLKAFLCAPVFTTKMAIAMMRVQRETVSEWLLR
ncbi:MAG: glycosyltransferase family A protein [Verrucomicrobiia bacterium]